MKKIKHVNQGQLQEMMLNFKKDVSMTGVTFANIIYAKDVDESRTKNKKKVLQKIVETRITLGADYTKKVQRIEVRKQGADFSDFQAMKMKGKTHTNGMENPVVHANKNPDFKMLVMIIENHVKTKNIYLHNGEVISYEEAVKEDLFQPSAFKEDTSTSGRGVVDKENDFKFRTLGFDKIIEMTLNKTTYIVVR